MNKMNKIVNADQNLMLNKKFFVIEKLFFQNQCNEMQTTRLPFRNILVIVKSFRLQIHNHIKGTAIPIYLFGNEEKRSENRRRRFEYKWKYYIFIAGNL